MGNLLEALAPVSLYVIALFVPLYKVWELKFKRAPVKEVSDLYLGKVYYQYRATRGGIWIPVKLNNYKGEQ